MLAEGDVASVTLPPGLFANISGNSVGVFFALYSEPTLFPVRQREREENDTLRNEVASPIVAATVGPGLVFTDIDPPVVINLRLTNLIIDRPEVSESLGFLMGEHSVNYDVDYSRYTHFEHRSLHHSLPKFPSKLWCRQ